MDEWANFYTHSCNWYYGVGIGITNERKYCPVVNVKFLNLLHGIKFVIKAFFSWDVEIKMAMYEYKIVCHTMEHIQINIAERK